MGTQSIQLAGKDYVIIEKGEYERLAMLAQVAALPEMPEPDENGHYPAKDFLRASIARDIVRSRLDARLSQKQLAELARIRLETLIRIESGAHSPSATTIEKIDRAISKAKKRK